MAGHHRAPRGRHHLAQAQHFSLRGTMTLLVPVIAPPVPPIAADELEAVVGAVLDREAAESDVDRLALLRRGVGGSSTSSPTS